MRPLVVVLVILVTVPCAAACGELAGRPEPPAACGDGIDNDGDGAIDFPDDLGCDGAADETEGSVALPRCNDKRDNDGDGKIDYPDDPGCPAPQVDSEDDDCPMGPGCPQCADGVDNDDNGLRDFPEDTGCLSASDGLELVDDSLACGVGLLIEGLPQAGLVTGMLTAAS